MIQIVPLFLLNYAQIILIKKHHSNNLSPDMIYDEQITQLVREKACLCAVGIGIVSVTY